MLKNKRTRKGVITILKSNHAISFFSLFSLFNVFRLDSINRGFGRGFSNDIWLLFGCIASVGSVGLTSYGCCSMMYGSWNAVNSRSITYRLKSLKDMGYIVSFRYKGRVRYKISSHAEKLIVKSIGKDQLRSIAQFVKASIKE